jgi:hypothetical protein
MPAWLDRFIRSYLIAADPDPQLSRLDMLELTGRI